MGVCALAVVVAWCVLFLVLCPGARGTAVKGLGTFQLQGRRPYQEDTFRNVVLDGDVLFHAVYDGHGGYFASHFVRDHLHTELSHDPSELVGSPKHALHTAFLRVDAGFLALQLPSGSTALATLLVGSHLWVANIGDCRAVMNDGRNAVALSIDHKPNRAEERQRLERLGWEVVNANGIWRVGGLAVSRSFGDAHVKGAVIAEPEVLDFALTDNNDFMVLASDGLWDVLTNQQVVEFVLGNGQLHDNPQRLAQALVTLAYQLGSLDNITATIVFFEHGEGRESQDTTAPETHPRDEL